MISSNFFARNQPTKSSNTFSGTLPISSNAFANANLTASSTYWSGDNTFGGAFSDDFGSFGTMFGQGQFGGYTHFLNRNPVPPISR